MSQNLINNIIHLNLHALFETCRQYCKSKYDRREC